MQVMTIPLGKQTDDVEARLPINGYFARPGMEITYDASGSLGVVVKYEMGFGRGRTLRPDH